MGWSLTMTARMKLDWEIPDLPSQRVLPSTSISGGAQGQPCAGKAGDLAPKAEGHTNSSAARPGQSECEAADKAGGVHLTAFGDSGR